MSEAVDNILERNPHLVEMETRLSTLDKYELALLEWRLRWGRQARSKQLPPPGDWATWGIMTGRGFGKTLAGSNWIGIEAALEPGSFNGLIGATSDDVRFVMIEGQTGLLSQIPSILIDDYNISYHKVTLWNGAMIRGFSAEEPSRLRGPQHHRVWADEVAAWERSTAIDVWDMMEFGLRLGKSPQVLWTTTPKQVPVIRKLIADKKAVIVGGSTYENRNNLSKKFYDKMKQYEGTKIGRQELSGELIDLEEDGIISRAHWQLWPSSKPLPVFSFVVLSLDTAFTERTIDKRTGERDPTASQAWGLFSMNNMYNVMLLDAWRDYLGFPELVKRVKKERTFLYGESEEPYVKTYLGARGGFRKGRTPDVIIIEDKGSGISLRQQLAADGVDTFPYNPKKMDKTARLHAVSPTFANLRVWVPESKVRPGEPVTWAEPVVSAVCTFKGAGSLQHDDDVDSCSQALLYLKDNFIGTFEVHEARDPQHDSGMYAPQELVNPYM